MKHTTDTKKQWIWFIGLWFAGLVSVAALAYAIRLLVRI